jgi:hypothetical protein
LLIGGLDMGVGADDSGRLSVQETPNRDFVSLVVSPCASTKMTAVSCRIAATAAFTAGNGFSRIGCMNVRICTLTTPTFPFAVSSTIDPFPGAPGG